MDVGELFIRTHTQQVSKQLGLLRFFFKRVTTYLCKSAWTQWHSSIQAINVCFVHILEWPPVPSFLIPIRNDISFSGWFEIKPIISNNIRPLIHRTNEVFRNKNINLFNWLCEANVFYKENSFFFQTDFAAQFSCLQQ